MRISDWSSDVCSSDLHLLVRGRSAVRLDVIGGTLLDGPASLRLDVSGIGHVDRATAALRDFLHLCRGGALPLKGTRLPPRAIDALRVHDALRSEEHTSELQPLMRISYAVFCWKTNTTTLPLYLHR